MSLLKNSLGSLKEILDPKTKPLPHQIEAIRHLVQNPFTALFDEQGLGKSKIVIDAICQLINDKIIDSALIVAPLSLLPNWEFEVQKHSFLMPITLKGGKKEKKYKYLTKSKIYLINYEAVITQLEILRRFCSFKKIATVLDEATRIKNPKTKTALAIFEIAKYSSIRIAITGTPVANNPKDLWSIYYFLDYGKTLGSDFEKFSSQFDEKDKFYEEKLKELRTIVYRTAIRRLKDEVMELPQKTFINCYLDLKPTQGKMYEEYRDELRLEIAKIDGTKIIDEANNIFKKLLRLTQIASNPKLLDKNYQEIPVKYDFIINKIDSILSSNESKVIIWTSFIMNLFELKKMLKKYNPLLLHGDLEVNDRQKIVQLFQGSSGNRVLIANPAAAKEGLTLTRANYAFYLDRNFSLTDYLQSQDRIHRIGQNKECLIFKIICNNTIDEYIDAVLEMKADVARYIQGDTKNIDLSSKEFWFSKSELLKILGGVSKQ